MLGRAASPVPVPLPVRWRSFADPIEAGPDAGLLDRLIAFTGRTDTQ